ncbi:MAG: sigma-70 family RNA polymerase sigma factor [Sphingobium sp.]
MGRLRWSNVKHERVALHLYETQRASLVGYAARLLGDRSRAEDIVQDAWLIFDQLPDQQAVRDPVAYLRRTVRNLSLNALRRLGQYQQIAGADVDDARLIVDQTPSAEDQAIARQSLNRFMERLAMLPERQRTAIRMHRLEGRKMREIADLFGVSIPMVHNLISDGLVKCADPADADPADRDN